MKTILAPGGQGTRLGQGPEYPVQLSLSSSTSVKLLRTTLSRPSLGPRW